MNSLVPDFTRNLLQTVRSEKEKRAPVDEKVVLSKDIAAFLTQQSSMTLGKTQKTGNY